VRDIEPVVFDSEPERAPVVVHGAKVIERIVLDYLMYDYNQAVLKPAGRKEVARVARYMIDHPDVKAIIEGHTDWIASEKYNLELGRRRAETVRDALVERGVSPDRLSIISYGESRPIADNTTDEGRARNRRAVINLISPEGKDISSGR